MSDEGSNYSACTSLSEAANGLISSTVRTAERKSGNPFCPKGMFSAQTNAENRSPAADEARAAILCVLSKAEQEKFFRSTLDALDVIWI